MLDSEGSDRLHMSQGKSSSTGNLLDKDDIPPPDYSMSSRAFQTQNVSTFKQRPYSVAVPAFSQDYLMPYGCALNEYSSGLCQLLPASYQPYPRSTAGVDDYGARPSSRSERNTAKLVKDLLSDFQCILTVPAVRAVVMSINPQSKSLQFDISMGVREV
uniref:Uncharacterized protein n=1 Tax=Sphaerodactylus townsendi TaxID=933632 RepID=A0ACB8EKY6_9SAUR